MAEVAVEWGGSDAFLWVDVEDEAELVGDLDIETFPTLLIQQGTEVLFFGPLLPGADGLRRLLRAIDESGAQPVAADADVQALAGRLLAHMPTTG